MPGIVGLRLLLVESRALLSGFDLGILGFIRAQDVLLEICLNTNDL